MRDRKTCPYCSGTWNGIIGPGGSYRVVLLEENAGEFLEIRTVDGTIQLVSYSCPKCGYTELYKQ